MDIARTNIFDVTPDELRSYFNRIGERGYRANQVLRWIYQDQAASFATMTDLSDRTRARLGRDFNFGRLKVLERQDSGTGYTAKFLLGIPEGDGVEAVFMRDRERVTYCISSQAGCPLACRFCATGYAGFTRNLTAGEILEQVQILARTIDTPSNIVFMGMGEPLLNVGAVIEAARGLTDPLRFGLSPRRITVSTVGIVPAMEKLATLERPVNLAISLHAPNDALRQDLMPINRQYSLEKVIAAAKRYLRATSRMITLEYIMIRECNMEPAHAEELAALARDTAAKVNLMAYNPVDEAGLKTPDAGEENAFRDRLRALGVPVTIRYRRGRDIDAACGQLRGRLLQPKAGIDG